VHIPAPLVTIHIPAVNIKALSEAKQSKNQTQNVDCFVASLLAMTGGVRIANPFIWFYFDDFGKGFRLPYLLL